MEILRARSIWWEEKGIVAACLIGQTKIPSIVYQAIGADHLSRLGLAKAVELNQFISHDQPVIDVELGSINQHMGIYHPKIVRINNQYIMTYTARSVYPVTKIPKTLSIKNNSVVPWRNRIGAYSTNDGSNFHWLGLWLKDFDAHHPILFDLMIHDRYWLFYSLGQSIFLSTGKRFGDWQTGLEVFAPAADWESNGLAITCRPIKTDYGWLIFYQAADQSDNYHIGAALFSLQNPAVVVKRSHQPLTLAKLVGHDKPVGGKLVSIEDYQTNLETEWLYWISSANVLVKHQVSIVKIIDLLS